MGSKLKKIIIFNMTKIKTTPNFTEMLTFHFTDVYRLTPMGCEAGSNACPALVLWWYWCSYYCWWLSIWFTLSESSSSETQSQRKSKFWLNLEVTEWALLHGNIIRLHKKTKLILFLWINNKSCSRFEYSWEQH